jgi:hypothetical protein
MVNYINSNFNKGKVGNPPFGTVVDQSIVSKNYEFYMVS